jgi:hypothetical protein
MTARLLRGVGLICGALAWLHPGLGQAEPAPRASEIAGRYSILRAEDKDTGCMLTLDTRARGPGGFKAQLAPACRDNGMVIFDPVGWGLEHGRLALTARKGHKTYFEWSDGFWRRNAKDGKALGLRHM